MNGSGTAVSVERRAARRGMLAAAPEAIVMFVAIELMVVIAMKCGARTDVSAFLEGT